MTLITSQSIQHYVIFILEKGYLQEEVKHKNLHVSDCLSNGHKVVDKARETDIVTLFVAHNARFPRSCHGQF